MALAPGLEHIQGPRPVPLGLAGEKPLPHTLNSTGVEAVRDLTAIVRIEEDRLDAVSERAAQPIRERQCESHLPAVDDLMREEIGERVNEQGLRTLSAHFPASGDCCDRL